MPIVEGDIEIDDRVIYKYVSLEDAKRVLLGRTLKFSNPDSFNDPFDCYYELLEFLVTEEFIRQHIDLGILKLAPNEVSMTLDELVSVYSEYYNFENPEVRLPFDDAMKNVWISCFSEINNDILMWSHYADKHKGCCIGFSLSGLLETFTFQLRTVRYTDVFEKYDYCSNSSAALDHMITTKSVKWKYEKEIRLLTRMKEVPIMDGFGIVPISLKAPATIIIGSKHPNPQQFKEELLDSGYPRKVFKKAIQSKNSFQLSIEMF